MADENQTADQTQQQTTTTQTQDQTQQTQQTQQETKVEKTADWRAIPEDAQDAEDLKKLVAKFTDPLAMFRAHAQAEKHASRAIIPPGKDAKPEDLARYRRQIGVPDKPEEYAQALKVDGINLEDAGTKTLMGAVFAAAHAANVPPHALRPIAAAVLESATKHAEAQQEDMKKAVETADGELRNVWRGDYEANTQMGLRFVQSLPEDIKKDMNFLLDNAVIDGIPAGEHPILRKAFAHWGRMVGETQLAGMGMDKAERDSAESEIDKLTTEALDARARGDTDTFKKKMAERDQKSKALWGD